MSLERFDREYTILLNFLKKVGFPKAPTKPESRLYAELLSYYLKLRIITSRLEEEIKDFDAIKQIFFQIMRSDKSQIQEIAENLVFKHAEIMLDLSDFYIYTRIFLDNLTVSIKLSFKAAKVRNWNVMENSVRGLLSKSRMESYRKKLDLLFFTRLEKHVGWIRGFKKKRDDLIHSRALLVFSTTRKGELGYEVAGPNDINWGVDTVREIRGGMQDIIYNLSGLMKYLHTNLPSQTVEV